MKRHILFLVFLFCFIGLSAQRTAEIAISTGVTNYVGDLGHEEVFPFSSVNTGSAITVRNFLNNPKNSGQLYRTLDLQFRFSWHRLQYDETDPMGGKAGAELRNYLRGISFRNDLFGAEMNITYNIIPDRQARLTRPKWNFYFLTGLGVFYGNPKADLFKGDIAPENRYHFWKDGTVRNGPENGSPNAQIIEKDGIYETDLRDWRTEGQGFGKEVHTSRPYNNLNIAIPFGGGIRYMYNKQLSFAVEFNYYYFFTDYLDDVSNRYATFTELKASFPGSKEFELAKYISDPTGHGTDGTTGPATSPRGNPNLNDAFTFLSLEASYKFKWKNKSSWGR